MALLSRFDPPAFLPDFNSIPGMLDAWHLAVSGWFDASIKADVEKVGGAMLQFYNPGRFDPGGVVVEQAITWNAFPKELLRRFGRERALMLADRVWPIEQFGNPSADPDSAPSASGVLYRPQEEYCEWHVLREPDTNKILRVTFTSEPPEYWQALSGVIPGDGSNPDLLFPGSHDHLLKLYREVVSPEVQLSDLIATKTIRGKRFSIKKGQYDFHNKWNTTHGIAHLNSPPNSLTAEIQLGADASIRYVNPDKRLLVEPEALIGYAGYGGTNRNSDPTIGSSVNALARLGAYVTLRNPVGLYMDHIDLSGWTAPDGRSVADCVRIVRGTPGMIERLVIEPPADRDFTIGDIQVAGVPVRFGGQIAECITVKLTGVANIVPQSVNGALVGPQSRGYIDFFHPQAVGGIDAAARLPIGSVEAFLNQGATGAPLPLPRSSVKPKTKATTAALKAKRPITHRTRH
jgi:hypothetical protein